MNNVIRTEKLNVGYGRHIVVNDISFSLEPGKILTLIGPNGSGKSTILKSITKQLKTLGGTVYLNGYAMNDMKEDQIAKQVSMVMTDRIRPEYITCKDMVATGRYPYTGRLGILTSGDWIKVDEAIELLHIEELANQNYLQISDGQKQRVMLARAICQDTPVMVLDEPTSYLDMRYKLDIMEHIRQFVREKKIAVLMSLHELDLAQKVSDSIACVDGDRISKIAAPEEIFQGDYIQRLYGVKENSFHPTLGIMNLSANTASPRYFVIAGGGSGIPMFEKLQREDIPFAAGILSENDIDFVIANAIASKVIATKAFYPIEEEHILAAKNLIDQCEACICTLDEFGPYNESNRMLLEYARETGKLVRKLEE